MQIFQTDPAGLPMHEYREMISPDRGWLLRPVGPARLGQLTSVSLKPGASYALAAKALHRVDVTPGELCITLLLRTDDSAGLTTRVFAEPGQDVPSSIPIKEMSGESYQEQLVALLSELTR